MLASLRDTSVGEFVSSAALGGGKGLEEAEPADEVGEEGGEDPHRMYFVLSFVLSLVRLLLLRGAGEQEIRVFHCDGRAEDRRSRTEVGLYLSLFVTL